MTSTAAAKIYNVYPRKGAIQAGSDADIVVWDPDRVKVLTAAAHFHNNDFSAWEGKQVKGAVSITISRGEVGSCLCCSSSLSCMFLAARC